MSTSTSQTFGNICTCWKNLRASRQTLRKFRVRDLLWCHSVVVYTWIAGWVMVSLTLSRANVHRRHPPVSFVHGVNGFVPRIVSEARAWRVIVGCVPRHTARGPAGRMRSLGWCCNVCREMIHDWGRNILHPWPLAGRGSAKKIT